MKRDEHLLLLITNFYSAVV